ncbi:MAG: FAD-binding oxidoreductase [Bdellovibrionales bacterium]|nr:FAD-binding oxidoreductase [Bdellovibrionales bacterium]
MSISYWLDHSANTSNETYDVVIVGAGLAGTSVAYWLKKEEPDCKIAILEKNELAGGASGRNAGFITCGSVEHFNRLVERWGEDLAYQIWNFSEVNLSLLKEHIIGGATDLEFDDKGTFSLASTDQEFHELQETAALMEKRGIDVETVNGSQIRTRLGAEGFIGGIKYLSDASINPLRLTRRICEKGGAKLFERTEVSRIEEGPEGTRSVVTNRGRFNASVVILALNGYLPSIDPYFADKVFPTRGQILTTEPVPKFMEGPCYAHFVLDYFRQVQDGRVLIGGFRQLEKETETGYSDHVTDKIQGALGEFLERHFPVLRGKKITHRWAGVMGFSVDGQPFVGAKPDDQQVFFLGGFTAHGLGLSFHTGKCLVDLMYGRDIPGFLSAKRF